VSGVEDLLSVAIYVMCREQIGVGIRNSRSALKKESVQLKHCILVAEPRVSADPNGNIRTIRIGACIMFSLLQEPHPLTMAQRRSTAPVFRRVPVVGPICSDSCCCHRAWMIPSYRQTYRAK